MKFYRLYQLLSNSRSVTLLGRTAPPLLPRLCSTDVDCIQALRELRLDMTVLVYLTLAVKTNHPARCRYLLTVSRPYS